MQEIKMVDLAGQYQKIKTEVDAGIAEVINTTAFIKGPQVKKFEDDLASYLNFKHVIGCANGTDALQIAMMALGLQPGDEVITPVFTYAATVEVIALLKLTPVFVEVNADTFNIDENLIEAAITTKTKAIVPVHLYGQCANMEAIMKIAEKHNLHLIEDTAQAIGADFTFSNGETKKAGTIGTIGCTSFFPSKNLGCYGDGGAIFCNDDALAEKLRMLGNHGQRKQYDFEEVGINSRLDTLQAAVLNVKLQHLDEYATARRKVADYYDTAFAEISQIKTPFRAKNSTHVFHQYTLKLDGNREAFREFLKEKGIPTMVYYPSPMHLQKAYNPNGLWKKGDFPLSESLSENVVSLPIHTEFEEDALKYITEAVKDFFTKV
jgi:dTDP-4-amino-4,6-dideoxygalactose transaminase